jgi:hypothetical protein
MIASMSLSTSERTGGTVVCNVRVQVRDADTNKGIYLAVVTVAWTSNNATRGMPTADVAYTDSSGVYKGRSKRIGLVPGAGCTARLVSIVKDNHVLLTPPGNLKLYQQLQTLTP